MNEPTEEKSRHFGSIVAAIIAAPVLYFLSFGPAVLIARANTSTLPLIRQIYYPLERIYLTVPQTKAPIDSYLRLWGVR